MESSFGLRKRLKQLLKRSSEVVERGKSPDAVSPTVYIENTIEWDPLARFDVIELHCEIWPSFNPGAFPFERAMEIRTHTRDTNFARWTRHEYEYPDTAVQYAKQDLISAPVDELPEHLYDLFEHKLVETSSIGHMEYTFISHVWGDCTTFDGRSYGLPWPVQIRDPSKLDMIFHAVRAIARTRYIWMDVLCMDQRPSAAKEKRAEIAKMGLYLRHAVGSLVWLDNAYEDARWNEVLSSIRTLNACFRMDHQMMANFEPHEGPLELLSLDSSGAYIERLLHILGLEQAPWFRRVWTLQEGVIPKKVFFCTPERYMFDGHLLWTYIGIVDIINSDIVARRRYAAQINNWLQRSEIFKMMQLRHLYRNNSVTIWHVAQAIRTRRCTVPREAIIGAWALLSRPMLQDYEKHTPELIFVYEWSAIIEEGDLTAAMNFGQRQFVTPNPFHDVNAMAPRRPAAAEQHELKVYWYKLPGNYCTGFIDMKGVGVERPRSIQPLLIRGTAMARWKQTDPGLRMMTLEKQLELAEAFDLHEKGRGKHLIIYPSALAILTAIYSIGDKAMIEGLGDYPNFLDATQMHSAQASLRYYEAVMLAGLEVDWALVLVSDEHNKSHLAIVAESVEYTEEILLVMPSSYQKSPGKGCLVCKRLDDGSYRKIGVGLGRSMSAKRTASIVVHQ